MNARATRPIDNETRSRRLMGHAGFRLLAVAAFAAVCVSAGVAADSVRVAGPEHQPRQPQVAVSHDGTAFITWGEGDAIQALPWRTGQTELGPPVRVGEVSDLMLGMRRGPRIAVAGNTVVVTGIGREGDILSWRSPDSARTWDGPIAVNDEPGSGREGLHDLAAGPEGEVYCVWLDLRNGSTQLWGSRSDDGARTWGANFPIYRSPDGHICECCHPTVECDTRGNVYVMWRNWLDGSRDMYVSVSRNGGANFEPAERLGTGTWRLDHCPMDGGHLAIAKPGTVTTIWRRDHDIFRTVSGERREERLGPGEQPWAAATRDGAWAVWVSRRPGDLWILGPGSQQPIRLAHRSADPVLAAPLAGTGPVVAVWESSDGESREVRAAVVSETNLSESK
jgi:hypothetical protein